MDYAPMFPLHSLLLKGTFPEKILSNKSPFANMKSLYHIQTKLVGKQSRLKGQLFLRFVLEESDP